MTPKASTPVRSNDFSIRKQMIACAVIVSGLFVGVGGWANSASLAGAIIASGSIVVERNVKKVQHSYGGIVSDILVKNGDHVTAGQVLLRLDSTQISAELGGLEAQFIEYTARAARLSAERDGASEIKWPENLDVSNPKVQLAINGETRLFRESRKVKAGQKEQLRSKLSQIREEISGLSSQLKAKAKEQVIIGKEFKDLSSLFAKNLTTATKVNALDREQTRIEGEHGSLVAQTARATAQISEIELQILNIDETVIANAQRDLVLTVAKTSELLERISAVRDKVVRVDIRAPRAGLVHELSVHTVGGVITAAEQLMLIVPDEDRLTIQARIQPHEVDQVTVGRPARLRLTAFNQQTTPEFTGKVVHVAGDVTTDTSSGSTYYLIRVEIDKNQSKIGDLKLLPGMPVEVFVVTDQRTVLSYLAKPITDQMQRAFRE